MLRHAGVRTKLLAVLALPTALLLAVTTLLVVGQVTAARRAGQVSALTDVAIQVNRVVHRLQDERNASLRLLQQGTGVRQQAVTERRAETDRQLARLGTLVAVSPVEQMSDAVQAAVGRSTVAHAELATARASIDAGRYYATETDVFYTKVIRTDLDLPAVVAASGTAELAQRLQAYGALSAAIEYSAHERDLVEVGLIRGTLTDADYAQVSALVVQQRQALQDYVRFAPAASARQLEDALAGSKIFEIDQVRRSLPELIAGRDPALVRSVEWVDATRTRIAPMTSAESAQVLDTAAVADDLRASQQRQAIALSLAAALGLLLALALAIGLARRITRPLRRLTAAAGAIGDELPRMVERMQTPGEGPGVTVEPIAVESSDEIGRLAEAFNTVNEVTVQVAREQAALRASIAEMFVNVARRNQVLLGRQLAQLDRMESQEADPDVLSHLFTLDHLATRMRRNAESLLVLAGIDSTRRLRRPLPISDVIRTAVGEIEDFDRIDLSMTEDPDVSGRHALTVAHLLAELLENATHFSNPDTRVVVSSVVTGHGVELTVTDYGLGMSEEEIEAANARIANPPVAEIAVSQRLGLFVVGRLAARLGATVALRRGRAAGLVVSVSLPVTVFEGLAEPAAAHAEDVSEDAPEVEVEVGESDVVEADVEPQPVVDVEPEPVVAVEPEPEPTPVLPTTARPAMDILPTSARRAGGRFGRHRASEPAVAAQADVPAAEPVLAPVAEAPAATEIAEAEAEPELVAEAEPEPTRTPIPIPVASMPSRVPAPVVALASAPVPAAPFAQASAPPAPPAPMQPPAGYAPVTEVAAAAPAGLARRTPKALVSDAAPTTTQSTPSTPSVPPRGRNPEQVRGMLSGFRAGVARGRDGAAESDAGAGNDQMAPETKDDPS